MPIGDATEVMATLCPFFRLPEDPRTSSVHCFTTKQDDYIPSTWTKRRSI